MKLIERPYQEALVTFFEPSARQIDVFGTNPAGNLLNADAKLRQFLLVDANLDFVLESAADLYRGRAFLCFEIGFDPVLRHASERLETGLAGIARAFV